MPPPMAVESTACGGLLFAAADAGEWGAFLAALLLRADVLPVLIMASLVGVFSWLSLRGEPRSRG